MGRLSWFCDWFEALPDFSGDAWPGTAIPTRLFWEGSAIADRVREVMIKVSLSDEGNRLGGNDRCKYEDDIRLRNSHRKGE